MSGRWRVLALLAERACLLLGVMAASCNATRPPGMPADDDAGVIDAGADECDYGCHWDCFGGSECVGGMAWVHGYGPRPCCQFGDPWPDPGPVCGLSAHACSGGVCVSPDPRYGACTRLIGTPGDSCGGTECEHLLLFCPEGAAKSLGAPCGDDRGCRPAAEGVARLRCDVGGSNTCVEDVRPPAPSDYGASCGLVATDVSWLDGEALVNAFSSTCGLCQVARIGDGCLRQGCTIACTFDEDCPSGAMCLCGNWGSPVIGYCAAATDRDTPEGRGAGLASCP